MDKNKLRFETTSFSLHLMAMLFMLCDHLWGTVINGNDWLTCIGRLAFPIYAFMIVEGYFNTKNLKKYVLRLLVFAIISEIPFNIAMGSRLFYPIHQNVLWSFLIAIGLIHWNEKVKEKKLWKRILVGATTIIIAYIGGIITFVDFYNAGLLMVLTFYFFRGQKWWRNFGTIQFITRQGFALFALIPIWLYKGKQGYHSEVWKYIRYGFYPLHLLVLGLIKIL